MNSLIKFGVAGALALGGSVAAHAGITVPTSSGSTGNVVLFADVFSGSTLEASYAGDTNISVSGLAGGPAPATFTDANLNALLGTATAGTTVVWALGSGGGQLGPVPYLVSTGPSATLNNVLSGSQLSQIESNFVTEVSGVNLSIGSATSGLYNLASPGTSTLNGDGNSGLGGSGFNPNLLGADAHNLYGASTSIVTTGLNTQSGLYLLSASSSSDPSGTLTDLFNVALTSSGLVFSDLGGGGSVPIPPALWLLGSGLLGLAAVARRKNGGMTSAA